MRNMKVFKTFLWLPFCLECRAPEPTSEIISSQKYATSTDATNHAEAQKKGTQSHYQPQTNFTPRIKDTLASKRQKRILKVDTIEVRSGSEQKIKIKNDPNITPTSFSELIQVILADAAKTQKYARPFHINTKELAKIDCDKELSYFLQKQCRLSEGRMRPQMVGFQAKALLYRQTAHYQENKVTTASEQEIKRVSEHVKDFSRAVFLMSLGRIQIDIDIEVVEDHPIQIGSNGRFAHSSIKHIPEIGFKFNHSKFETLTEKKQDFYIIIRKKANKSYAWGSAYSLQRNNPYPGDIEVYYENLEYSRTSQDEISGLIHEFIHIIERWYTSGQLAHQTSEINPWHVGVNNSWVTWYRAILEGKVTSITGNAYEPEKDPVKNTGFFLSDLMLQQWGTRLKPTMFKENSKVTNQQTEQAKYKVIGHSLYNPPLRINQSYMQKALIRGGFKVEQGLGLHPKLPLSYLEVIPPFEQGGQFSAEVGYTMIDTENAVNFVSKTCASAANQAKINTNFSVLIYGVFQNFGYKHLWSSGIQTACSVPRGFRLARTYTLDGEKQDVKKFILVINPLKSIHSDHVGLFNTAFLFETKQPMQTTQMGLTGEGLQEDFEQILWD